MLYTITIILLVLAIIASIPSWPYSRSWGYAPTGILTVLAIIVLVLAFSGWGSVNPAQ